MATIPNGAGPAAPPPPRLSVSSDRGIHSPESETEKEGVRIPRWWEGGNPGGAHPTSTKDNSTDSSLRGACGPSETFVEAIGSKAENIPTTNTTITPSVPALGEHYTPTNSAADSRSSAVAKNRSSDLEAGKASGDGAVYDSRGGQTVKVDSMATDDIPKTTAVLATTTEPQRVKIALAPQRGRFGRAHRIHNEATKAEARRRFWDGVTPARSNSANLTPPGEGTPTLSVAALRAAMKLKKKANIIQAKTAMNKYIVDPRSPRIRYWKNWMLISIMFTVLVTPWRISFRLPVKAFGLVIAGIINISFIVDTVLHFFLAVETEAGLLTDRKQIVRRYVTSWFFLDLLTCLPYTTLLRNVIPASMRVLAPMRGLRLLKLLKVVKVYTMHYEVSPVAMSIGKTLVTVILAAHLLSCFWFWIHCYEDLEQKTPKPWNQCGDPSSVASQYLSSFYFIIYTMMTVGYGDQHADPLSGKALVLSVFIQLTGATLFGFIIAATRRIVQFIAPIQKVATTNLQKISEYALDRRLPDRVSTRIKRHFRYFYFKTSVFDERAVMEHVPWQLCHEVMSTTHSVAINATGLLQDHDLSPIALMRLARAMKPMELDSGEEAMLQGDVVLQAYFVIKGRIEAYVHEESGRSWVGGETESLVPLRQSTYLGVWGPGSLWGLSNIMLGGFSEATFVAALPTDLLWLDQSDLIQAIEETPEIRACLEHTATAGQRALLEALASNTITKEGLKLKQISLTDFKASDLKQQLKHTDMRNLCMAASADQLAAASARQAAAGSAGGVAGMVQDFQQMASFSGRGVWGRLKSILVSVKGALRGQRAQMRLVRTWRSGTYGFGCVYDGRGREVKGVIETEETPEELNRRWITLPDQPIKLRWDVAISMVCVLVSVFTPYRMAFANNDAKTWLVFDAVVDVLFVVDILLCCRTACIGNAANNVIVYITVPGMIAKRYLRGWMLLDITSTIPGYLFGASDKVFRALVLLKLLRIGRVPALAQQLHRLREQQAMAIGGARGKSWLRGIQVDVPRWCLDVAQILVVILYASHIFGCFWWVTSRYDESISWWQQDGLDVEDTTSTYIASLYWGATTITTVGYGDLLPTDDLERMVACVTMICGTTMFSYVIGSVSTLVMNPTGGNVRRSMELMNVENYLEEQKVGAHLGNSVRTHMVFVTGARSAWNEEHILSRLPPRVQERVLEHVHREAALIIPVLKTRPPSFVAAMLRNLRPRQYSQGECVYKNLQMSQGVYFVTKGIAEAFVRVENESGTGEEERVKGIVGEGKFFGYSRFLAAFLEEDMAVRAFTQLYVYLLSNSCIQYLLQYHPFLAEELRNGLEEAVFQQASEEISSEKKRTAARQALYGGKGNGNASGTGKPPPVPQTRRKRSSSEHNTSALASYLREESASVGPILPGRSKRIPPKGVDTSRKREAAGVSEREESGSDEEERRAGREAARRAGYIYDREDNGGDPRHTLTWQGSEDDSITFPGLSGMLVTQLTWGKGSNMWDAALLDEANGLSESAQTTAAAAAAATAASSDRKEGLIGTTAATAVDMDGNNRKRSKRADESGVLDGKGVGHDSGRDEAEVSNQEDRNGDGGGRRRTFTERLIPLQHRPPDDAGFRSREQEGDPRHIPPSTTLPQDRVKIRGEGEGSQGESSVDGTGDMALR